MLPIHAAMVAFLLRSQEMYLGLKQRETVSALALYEFHKKLHLLYSNALSKNKKIELSDIDMATQPEWRATTPFQADYCQLALLQTSFASRWSQLILSAYSLLKMQSALKWALANVLTSRYWISIIAPEEVEVISLLHRSTKLQKLVLSYNNISVKQLVQWRT